MRATSRQEIDSLIDTAHAMADAARQVTLRYFRRADLIADNKGGATGYDPVTIADREAEDAMRAVLARARPDDAILGEERGATPGTTGLTWVLDPIDGTRAFLAGTPTWGVLIALRDEHGPFLGVIDQPYIGERFLGAPGRAELIRGENVTPLRARPETALRDALICTTFPEVGSPAEGAAFRTLAAQTRLTRYGLDCYAYGLLAAGHVDLVVEAGLNAYDIQAPIAVIEAAGGIVTDWDGGPAHDGGRALAAANQRVHAEALAVLRGTAP